MHATVDRKILLGALDTAARIAPAKSTVPIVSCVLVTTQSGKLTLMATNLDVAAALDIPATANESGEAAIPLGPLHGFVKSTSGTEVDLSLEGMAAIVKCGKAKLRLATLPPRDFPDELAHKRGTKLGLDTTAFLNALSACQYAICNDKSRHYLHGVNLRISQGTATLTATDGHLGTRLKMPALSSSEDLDIIIPPWPPRFSGAFEIEADANILRLAKENLVFVSKLVDGSFPDFDRIVPAPKYFAEVNRLEFAAAVERCNLDGTLLLRHDGTGVLHLSAEDSNGTAVFDEIPIEGDGFNFSISANLLGKTVESFASEFVTIGMEEASTPIVVTCPDQPDRIALVMLMRMPENPCWVGSPTEGHAP